MFVFVLNVCLMYRFGVMNKQRALQRSQVLLQHIITEVWTVNVRKSKRAANDFCCCVIEPSIAYCAPVVVVIDFKTSFLRTTASSQSHCKRQVNVRVDWYWGKIRIIAKNNYTLKCPKKRNPICVGDMCGYSSARRAGDVTSACMRWTQHQCADCLAAVF